MFLPFVALSQGCSCTGSEVFGAPLPGSHGPRPTEGPSGKVPPDLGWYWRGSGDRGAARRRSGVSSSRIHYFYIILRNVEGQKSLSFLPPWEFQTTSPWGPLDFFSTCLGNNSLLPHQGKHSMVPSTLWQTPEACFLMSSPGITQKCVYKGRKMLKNTLP